VQKVQKDFLGKTGPKLPHFEENNLKTIILKKTFPTNHHFIVGTLKYSTSHFDLESNLVNPSCMITNPHISQI
jgi:hypothetical protein